MKTIILSFLLFLPCTIWAQNNLTLNLQDSTIAYLVQQNQQFGIRFMHLVAKNPVEGMAK